MSDLRTAAKQALEALQCCSGAVHWPVIAAAIKDLRTALEQPANEPVACPSCGSTQVECVVCAAGFSIALQPQPQEAVQAYDSATHAAAMAVFITRMDSEQPDADDKGVSGWLQEAEERIKLRASQTLSELVNAPQPQPEKRPQNCGTGFCSCIECPYPDHFPDARKMMEPFGYFRSTLDGWEDCAETDEGAKPLYEAPRPQHEQDNDLLTIAYMAGFDAGKKTAPQPDHFADAGKPMEREWVDLPPEEIKALANLPGADRERTAVEMAYAVQAKLRERNT